MCLAYRLIKKARSKHAFDGEGSRIYGGRWNSKGKSCVYLASSPSLALLEVMVHLEDYSLLSAYTLFKLNLSGFSLLELSEDSLPIDWKNDPAPNSTAQVGDDWLLEMSSLGLYVPSTIMPIEKNIILNTNHVDFNKVIKTAEVYKFYPDPRL